MKRHIFGLLEPINSPSCQLSSPQLSSTGFLGERQTQTLNASARVHPGARSLPGHARRASSWANQEEPELLKLWA